MFSLAILLMGDPNSGGGLFSLLPLILIMFVFYFLLIRPQKKREDERKKMIAAVEKGDDIITVGGVYGKVTQVDETSVLAQVDTNTKLRIDKNAIQSVPSREKATEKK